MRSYLHIFIVFFCSIYHLQAQTAVGSWTMLGPVAQPMRTANQNGNGVGRLSQIKFHPTDSMKMYVVACAGGIFISSDKGRTWANTPGTDVLPTTGCSSVCIDYTNDSIIYLGTGDGNAYSGGMGVWKSTNAGTTFAQSNSGMGNIYVTEILMSPTDHNTLLASTKNGVYKTTNAGSTWTKTQNDSIRFEDMKIKPGSNSTVYATTGRTFYLSTDFGSTWTSLTYPVIPSSNLSGRLIVTPADSQVIYFGASADYGYVLKSTNGGTSFISMWTTTSKCIRCYDSTLASGSQGDYNFTIAVNPLNPDEIIWAGQNIWRSLNSGVSWNEVQDEGATNLMWDMHHLVFDPYYPNEVFLACDGGVWSTVDTLKSIWRARNTGIGAMQTYGAAQHPLNRNVYSTGNQDVGEQLYTPDSRWTYIGGGDMLGAHYFDYRTGNNLWTPYTGQWWAANDSVDNSTYSMNSPYAASYPSNVLMAFWPNLPNTAIYAWDSVYRSTNISATTVPWTLILANTHQIQDIGFCAADSNTLYVLTNNDTLYRSDNALAATPTFTKLAGPAATNGAGKLTSSKSNSNFVYVAAGHRLYWSKDKGVSWTNISYNLPTTTNIVGLVHDDYSTTERLFVASGTGVYYKDSTTTTWTLIPGSPTVASLNVLTLYNDGTSASVLRIATYGRSVWECPINNNLKPIASLSANKQYICPGDTVNYSLTCYGQPTSVAWSFPGGSPSSSTSLNPVVVYGAAGVYNAQVIVTNTGGADTVLMSSYITASTGSTTTLSQGFEGAFPPPGWLLESTAGEFGWYRTDSASGYEASAHSTVFDNYNYDADGTHNKLITQPMDLYGKTKASITFDVSYQYTYGYQDSLMVQASGDCGENWVPVYVKGAPLLATATQGPALYYGAPEFIPSSATQWRTDTINMDQFVNSTVLLSFEDIGHGGSTLYLDNINLSTSTNSNTAVTNINNETPDFSLYPNPATGMLNIKASKLIGKRMEISCYNVLGSLVVQQIEDITNGILQTTINLSTLPVGFYQVKLQADGGAVYTRKVVLE